MQAARCSTQHSALLYALHTLETELPIWQHGSSQWWGHQKFCSSSSSIRVPLTILTRHACRRPTNCKPSFYGFIRDPDTTCLQSGFRPLDHVTTQDADPRMLFQHMYRASFVILYYDQQMHNYFANYHTPTCFDTVVSSSGNL